MERFDDQVIGDQVKRFLGVTVRIVALFFSQFAGQWSLRDQGRDFNTGAGHAFDRQGDGLARRQPEMLP